MTPITFTAECMVCGVELVRTEGDAPPPDMIAALARAHDASTHGGPRKEAAYQALATAVTTITTITDEPTP